MTGSGTDISTVIDMTAEEYAAFLEGEAGARLGMSVAEFTEQYLAGKLDDADPDVPLLAMWIGMGHNGHRVTA